MAKTHKKSKKKGRKRKSVEKIAPPILDDPTQPKKTVTSFVWGLLSKLSSPLTGSTEPEKTHHTHKKSKRSKSHRSKKSRSSRHKDGHIKESESTTTNTVENSTVDAANNKSQIRDVLDEWAKAVNTPAETPGEKVIEKAVEKPTENSIEKSDEKPLKKPVKKPIDTSKKASTAELGSKRRLRYKKYERSKRRLIINPSSESEVEEIMEQDQASPDVEVITIDESEPEAPESDVSVSHPSPKAYVLTNGGDSYQEAESILLRQWEDAEHTLQSKESDQDAPAQVFTPIQSLFVSQDEVSSSPLVQNGSINDSIQGVDEGPQESEAVNSVDKEVPDEINATDAFDDISASGDHNSTFFSVNTSLGQQDDPISVTSSSENTQGSSNPTKSSDSSFDSSSDSEDSSSILDSSDDEPNDKKARPTTAQATSPSSSFQSPGELNAKFYQIVTPKPRSSTHQDLLNPSTPTQTKNPARTSPLINSSTVIPNSSQSPAKADSNMPLDEVVNSSLIDSSFHSAQFSPTNQRVRERPNLAPKKIRIRKSLKIVPIKPPISSPSSAKKQ